MATITVRNLDDTTKARLRLRAARNGRSTEAEVRAILDAAAGEVPNDTGLGAQFAAIYRGVGSLDVPTRGGVPSAADFSPPSELSTWIDRVRAGEEIVVTDRGVPVVRLTPVQSAPRLAQLMAEGVISRPENSPRPRAGDVERAPSTGSVSELVAAQRQSRGL